MKFKYTYREDDLCFINKLIANYMRHNRSKHCKGLLIIWDFELHFCLKNAHYLDIFCLCAM